MTTERCPATEADHCGNSTAAAMAFFRSDVWRSCVRKKGHDGGCVFGLSEYDHQRLSLVQRELLAARSRLVKLEEEEQELLAHVSRTEAARGT